MATLITNKQNIEWDKESKRARFPWDEWTDGEVWQAVEGKDFQSKVSVFKQQLKKRAETHGLTLLTSTQKDGTVSSIVFQFQGTPK